jgi:transmembrane sensor
MVGGTDGPTADSMDTLIERSLRGEASQSELNELETWRCASLSNERHYRQVVRLLDAARSLQPSEGEGIAPTAAALLAQPRGTVASPAPHAPRWGRWAAAAVAVVAAITLAALLGGRTVASPWGPSEVFTGAAEMATVQLRDGSVVRLAPASRLRVIERAGRREVSLDGRAFFAVAPMPTRPFVVTTRHGEARVLGTRFELSTDDNELRLLVVEGRVALSARNIVEVRGGEASSVRQGLALAPTRVADPEQMERWVGRFLVFQSTPMRDVAKEVDAMYGVRLVPVDSAMARRTLTATFIDRSADQVIEVICSVVSARCERRGEDVWMSTR